MAPARSRTALTTLNGLGVQVVRFTVRWDAGCADGARDSRRPAGSCLRLVGADRGARRASLARDRRRPATRRCTFLVERRQAVELRADTRQRRSVRSRPLWRTQYPWIRKFQIWNEPNQARWLRPTSAPLYVTRLLNPAYAAIHARDQGREGRRRENRTERLDRRCLAACLDRRHASRARAPRRVRTQPVSARPETGDPAARTTVRDLHDSHDGDARAGSSGSSRAISRALGSG